MAYTFGAANADRIDCGASVAHSIGDFTLWMRFKLAVGGSGLRMLCSYRDTNINFQIYTLAGDLNANVTRVGAGEATASIAWTSSISENVEYRIAFQYDKTAHRLRIFADTDATEKVNADVTTSGSADIEGTQHFLIGNYLGATDGSIHGIVYEVGWWPTTLLSGAQLAAMGAGTPPATDPTDYWPLVSDAVALFGGHNGTVTGASVVAHSGTNLYGSAPPAPARFAVGAGFGGRHAVISG